MREKGLSADINILFTADGLGFGELAELKRMTWPTGCRDRISARILMLEISHEAGIDEKTAERLLLFMAVALEHCPELIPGFQAIKTTAAGAILQAIPE